MQKYSVAIRFGLVWGISSIIYTLIQYLITENVQSGILSGILVFLAGIGIMYYIGIKRREEIGGFISWKEAMTHIWVGGIISSVLTTFFMLILYNFIAPDLIEQTKEMQIELIEKFRGSMGDTAADAQIEKLESSNPFSFVNSLLILGGGILIQFLLACVVALAVKNEDPNSNFSKYNQMKDQF
ncbi:MAG: DUF4199 domain-containing protein [Saprospiraceae bacterium]